MTVPSGLEIVQHVLPSFHVAPANEKDTVSVVVVEGSWIVNQVGKVERDMKTSSETAPHLAKCFCVTNTETYQFTLVLHVIVYSDG